MAGLNDHFDCGDVDLSDIKPPSISSKASKKRQSYMDRLRDKRDLQNLQEHIRRLHEPDIDDFERYNNSEDKTKQMIRRYRRATKCQQ